MHHLLISQRGPSMAVPNGAQWINTDLHILPVLAASNLDVLKYIPTTMLWCYPMFKFSALLINSNMISVASSICLWFTWLCTSLISWLLTWFFVFCSLVFDLSKCFQWHDTNNDILAPLYAQKSDLKWSILDTCQWLELANFSDVICGSSKQ